MITHSSHLITNDETKCLNPLHNARLIESICTNPQCDNPLSCLACSIKCHKKCQETLLLFDDILARSFQNLDDWPHNEIIRSYLQKSDDITTNYTQMEKSINNLTQELKTEIVKIVDNNMEKIRSLILERFQTVFGYMQELQNVYDIDSFAKDIEAFKNNQQSQESFTTQIKSRFQNIATEENRLLSNLPMMEKFPTKEDSENLFQRLISLKARIVNTFEELMNSYLIQLGKNSSDFQKIYVIEEDQLKVKSSEIENLKAKNASLTRKVSELEKELKSCESKYIEHSHGLITANAIGPCEYCYRTTTDKCQTCDRMICDICLKKR